jgi:hypothetical protein
VIWVCVTTYSVMSDLSLCENVFCNEWSEFVWQLQNMLSHKLRSLITEYVVTQTQITYNRIRCHTNSDHSLQNTLYSVISDLSLCDNVFCNEWSEFVWPRILLWVIWVCVTTYSVISDLSLWNTLSHKLR